MSLQGRVAIVTGGSRGIGAGIAQELGKRGAKVVITYAASSAKAEKVVEIIKTSSDAIAIKADCMDPASPEKIVSATIQTFGERVDIIVNNAGAGDELFLEDTTLEHFDKVFYTNVRFPMFLVKSCLPYLQNGGRIVNLSSVVARQGWAMQGAYGASKACMESLARTWATELGHKYGVTVNCVNPGPVATDMWNATPPDAAPGIEGYIKSTPAAPRVGEVDDVVQIVAFLCEEGSRWVTGSTVCANGGACLV
ncbi:hypothetical protein NPX13_g80 [Xylaria arbuscula]|uniref:Ketoreductase domain-containing protein n=1 Tax=Xylaria arbuscula TaxID=114810 RepID=A0A9W8NNJ1_9PEZI|nr:hypothetical protein NPX13_g80 [Xylaria arbuscula]